jgi:uncharacterized protein (TIGR03437 family)
MRGSCPGEPDARVRFKLDTTRTRDTGLIVSPSEGTTPVQVQIGVNPDRVGNRFPGTTNAFLYFTTVDQTPPVAPEVWIQVNTTTPDPPIIQSVVNAASLAPVVTPGAVVLIRGTSLGPNMSHTLDQTGLYPTTLGNTTVTFNGIPAPLLSSSPTAIKAVAPYGLAGQTDARVVVTHYPQSRSEQVSAAFSVRVAETSLGIFNRTQTGDCQNDIQNCDATGCTPNSAANPATPGSIIVLFATGVAPWTGPRVDGSVAIVPQLFSLMNFPALTIGGQPASIRYAGTAPYQVWGMFQVNALVPEGIGSGPQPVILAVGEASNDSRQATVFVQ